MIAYFLIEDAELSLCSFLNVSMCYKIYLGLDNQYLHVEYTHIGLRLSD